MNKLIIGNKNNRINPNEMTSLELKLSDYISYTIKLSETWSVKPFIGFLN